MPPTALLERDLGAREDDGELGSDDGERIGDPPLRDPASGVDAGAEAAPERAAHREPDHRRVDERRTTARRADASCAIRRWDLSSRKISATSQRAA